MLGYEWEFEFESKIGHVICGTQYKIKILIPLLKKIIKNFMIVTAEH